ncbi:chaperone protein dnaJ 72 [Silene latifolia]|uniref:chaperone protein dnaJ 72 n=1 Tax=Silene latifolia TaxID=37657 RepID=UPI003D77BC4A
MADHYKVLGITKHASKDDIKHAFRKLAVQFHPDKHAQSPKSARDAATLKFKQVSEAYEVLIDDRKRAAYNFTRYTTNYSSNSGNYHGTSYNNGYNARYYHRGGSFYRPPPSSKRFVLNVEAVLQYMMTRGFLLNLAFAGVLLGGTVAVDMSRETLWKIRNPGKSFEEALESIEKNKARKDKQ